MGQLIVPPRVEDKRDEWGFVTRLRHLDDMVEDVNSPFELYKRDDPNHFNLDIQEVSLETEMPVGIGVSEQRYTKTATVPGQADAGEWVLVDPMTKEIINKVAVLDDDGKQKLNKNNGEPVFQVNDHWFVLNFKFVWREAPEPPEQPVSSQLSRMSTMRPGASQPASPPSSGSASKKSVPDIGEF